MKERREAELDVQLARLADGDRGAFSAVFKLLQDPITRLCIGILKNDADARDATQQAMEKILERASDYDRLRPALPWACAIAVWECRTIQRRRARRREVSEEPSDHATVDGESEVVHREAVNAALHALESLSDSDRETLVASFTGRVVEGDISSAGKRKRRQRALARLRASFRRLYGLD